MKRPAADNQALFEGLLEPCRKRVWTFLLRLAQNRTHAEDLYQDTLLRAWQALPTYRERGRFLSWLFRIAHNVVRDDRRRRASRPTLVVPIQLPDIPDSNRAGDKLEAGEKRRHLGRCLTLLTENQREVLLLRMHSDLTFRGIAELTGEPLSTVINRMRDALAKLGRAMEDEKWTRPSRT